MNKFIASCRSPRAEVVQYPEGFRSRVKITRNAWMESAAFADLEDAMAVCRRYIREESFGRMDPYRALKGTSKNRPDAGMMLPVSRV